MSSAWSHTRNGQVSESIYPYVSGQTGSAGTCYEGLIKNMTLIKTVEPIVYVETIEEFKSVLLEGPVAVVVAAGNACFSNYRSGILNCTCPENPSDLDHAKTIVGRDSDYWIAKNQ